VEDGNRPHRRPNKRGSFGGRFDELVKQFPERHDGAESATADEAPASDSDESHINDRLFESAWRKAREAERSRAKNGHDEGRASLGSRGR
jgi:hypothetical protein